MKRFSFVAPWFPESWSRSDEERDKHWAYPAGTAPSTAPRNKGAMTSRSKPSRREEPQAVKRWITPNVPKTRRDKLRPDELNAIPFNARWCKARCSSKYAATPVVSAIRWKKQSKKKKRKKKWRRGKWRWVLLVSEFQTTYINIRGWHSRHKWQYVWYALSEPFTPVIFNGQYGHYQRRGVTQNCPYHSGQLNSRVDGDFT